jgi:hypothetical protein
VRSGALRSTDRSHGGACGMHARPPESRRSWRWPSLLIMNRRRSPEPERPRRFVRIRGGWQKRPICVKTRPAADGNDATRCRNGWPPPSPRRGWSTVPRGERPLTPPSLFSGAGGDQRAQRCRAGKAFDLLVRAPRLLDSLPSGVPPAATAAGLDSRQPGSGEMDERGCDFGRRRVFCLVGVEDKRCDPAARRRPKQRLTPRQHQLLDLLAQGADC